MKIIISLSLFLCLSSCVSSTKTSPNASSKPHIEIINFEEVDINQDGNITEKEFQQAKSTIHGKNSTSYKEPVLTFVGIMVVVGMLIFLSSSLNKKNRKKNVRS